MVRTEERHDKLARLSQLSGVQRDFFSFPDEENPELLLHSLVHGTDLFETLRTDHVCVLVLISQFGDERRRGWVWLLEVLN